MKGKERFYTLLAPAILILSFLPLIVATKNEIKGGVPWFEWFAVILAGISLLCSLWGIHLIMGALDERRRKKAFSLFISMLITCIPWVGLAVTYLFPLAKP
jgi:hypothetical protein